MLKLISCIAICQSAGIMGAFFTQQAILEWFVYLRKPPFNPPNWIFAPVWTFLYILMGIAASMVWRKGFNRPDVRVALAIFAFQLILNASWSLVFFGARSIMGGLVINVILWCSILWTMRVFSHISKTASYLLIPYILWVSFALILNMELLRLN